MPEFLIVLKYSSIYVCFGSYTSLLKTDVVKVYNIFVLVSSTSMSVSAPVSSICIQKHEYRDKYMDK